MLYSWFTERSERESAPGSMIVHSRAAWPIRCATGSLITTCSRVCVACPVAPHRLAPPGQPALSE